MKSSWFSGTGSLGGILFSLGCPACVPAMAALFSVLGLGFLINMKILGTITLLFLLLGIGALYINSKKHNKRIFLIIGLVASIGLFSSRYVFTSDIPLYSGAVLLLGNALVDYKHTKKVKSCCLEKK